MGAARRLNGVHWRTAARAPLQQFSAPLGRKSAVKSILALRGACLQLNQVTIALRAFSLLDFMNHVDESAHGGALQPMPLADLSDRGDLNIDFSLTLPDRRSRQTPE